MTKKCMKRRLLKRLQKMQQEAKRLVESADESGAERGRKNATILARAAIADAAKTLEDAQARQGDRGAGDIAVSAIEYAKTAVRVAYQTKGTSGAVAVETLRGRVFNARHAVQGCREALARRPQHKPQVSQPAPAGRRP